MQSLLPGSGYQKQLLAAQGQLQSSTAQLQVELLQSQAKMSELEAQVSCCAARTTFSQEVVGGIPGEGASRGGGHPGAGGRRDWMCKPGVCLLKNRDEPLIGLGLGAEVGAGADPAQDAAGEFAAAAPGRLGAH